MAHTRDPLAFVDAPARFAQDAFDVMVVIHPD